jgi:hypothetical protein
MSDLLSPLYVVFAASEADAFWGLVGVMRMMVSLSILMLAALIRTLGKQFPARPERDEATAFDATTAYRSHGPRTIRSSW